MAPNVIEGTWEDVIRHGVELAGKRVRLTVLPAEEDSSRTAEPGAPVPAARVTFGMFPQLQEITEEDFKSAQFRGDTDDGPDWR